MDKKRRISFDIDGTLVKWVGGEASTDYNLYKSLTPKPKKEVVKRFKELNKNEENAMGIISQRSNESIKNAVEKYNLSPDFICGAKLSPTPTAGKSKCLYRFKKRYPSDKCIHIGDANVDRYAAKMGGCEYLTPEEAESCTKEEIENGTCKVKSEGRREKIF